MDVKTKVVRDVLCCRVTAGLLYRTEIAWTFSDPLDLTSGYSPSLDKQPWDPLDTDQSLALGPSGMPVQPGQLHAWSSGLFQPLLVKDETSYLRAWALAPQVAEKGVRR